jgi:hypothetical protein
LIKLHGQSLLWRIYQNEKSGNLGQYIAGQLVNRKLISALNRTPGMAAIDVFESEPFCRATPVEVKLHMHRIGHVEQDSYEIYFGAADNVVVNFGNTDQYRVNQGRPSSALNAY